jgi:dTDP-4-dehydrorhamnose reductase
LETEVTMRNTDKSGNNVLIFGASGMFGRELYRESLSRAYKTTGVFRHGPDYEIDLLDVGKVQKMVLELRPDLIINSAVIVSHGLCEENPDLAYPVNAKSIADMADLARQTNARFVHISTDHFFTGDCAKLHDESSPVTLLNEYAKTKHAGESFALTCPQALVIRTNITGLRGDEGGVMSFFEWVLKVLNSSEEFNLFEDYFTSTISTRQAASILYDLLDHGIDGIINLASREAVSKKQFVEAVALKIDASMSHARTKSVHDYLSSRAECVGLDVSKAKKVLGKKLPTLDDVVDQLLTEYRDNQSRSNNTRLHIRASA